MGRQVDKSVIDTVGNGLGDWRIVVGVKSGLWGEVGGVRKMEIY